MSLMHLFLLLLWMAIAAILRFTNLTLKPLWTDEFSTLVFSLGNSFLTIPLDRAISLMELLQPLQPSPQSSIQSVLTHLFTQSNHPPLYFVLSHLWLKNFPTVNGWVSVGAARGLSALFGVLAVPMTFYLGWLAWRSRLAGHLAALLMALSPFGIYLAQEARHYTLAILWILGSLACLVKTTHLLRDRRSLPLWLGLVWVGVNGLGIATHYFFILTLVTEAIVLTGLLLLPNSALRPGLPIASCNQHWLVAVAGGTLATGLAWIPMLLSIRGTELTRWISRGEFDSSTWIDPPIRTVAGLVSMVYLLPIQGVPAAITLLSGLGVGIAALGTGWMMLQGLPLQKKLPNYELFAIDQDPLIQGSRGDRRKGWAINNAQVERLSQAQLSLQVLGGYGAAAIALSLILTYGFGVNFANVFRYQFFYFPAVIVIVGAGLAGLWQQKIVDFRLWILDWKVPWTIGLVCLLSFLGGLTVVADLGYQKTHRPDVVAEAISASFQAPTLVAIPYKTHGQTGRLMGIAWSLWHQHPNQAQQIQFLLNQMREGDEQQAIAPLQSTLKQLPRPLDVWRINFRSELNPLSHTVLTQAGCTPKSQLLSVDGYRYQSYACQ
ncbi:glycosyltransferase family 39 protein [Leptodesmis sp.]|uniref:glycosyltransferase family 39 protein n=1 Tax=Leptodesmis sp. TaxID=3100501 RepID=UPI0040535993